MNHSNRRSLQLIKLSPLALALAMASAHAATRVDLHGQNLRLLNSQYKLAAAASGMPTSAKDRHAEILGLDAESDLRVLTSAMDPDGTSHVRYQQTFRGVPIFGEQIIVSADSKGDLKSLFGRQVGNLARELPQGASLIAKSRALSIAKAASLGSRVSSMILEREDARQMIYIGDDQRARMSYVVSFFADSMGGGSPTRPFVIVDAQNGKILKQWEGLTHVAVGTGPGGNGKTGQYEWGTGGQYGYLDVAQSGSTCTMNNTDVKSVNLNGSTGTSTTAWAYTCPRNTTKAINGAYAPINDAHYFGGVIQDMYLAYTGSKALTFQLVMRVHYGSSYENAFWNGSTMSFGDGATTFYPLVNADVSGHEVSHGFTEQHSNLTYSGQSGGMNEAFSDMGGEATEYFWKGSNDFKVGTEIFKSAGALRYMANPPLDGGSIDNAANYTSSMDVHYSSGVYNKAFYLLATKAGWDTKKAFQVFARANSLYWTASSTFNTGACGVETAATDLGFSKADVTSAFTAVGVACATGGGSSGGVLANGVATTGISAATGAYAKYTMVVPAGATGLKFVMSGGTGDADMYVKFGSAPTDTTYDCRPYANGNAETCTIATAQAGTYYVNLKAYSSFTGVSLTGSYTAGGTSNSPPVANFSFTTSGLAASFTDSSTDSDGTIASRSWNFGDGSSSTSTNPSHTYASAGTYTVTETVTDNSGASNSKSASVTVTAVSAQVYTNTANYTISDKKTVDSPITVSGRSGNAPAATSVSVNIVHTYQGDLRVDLVAPDGSLYNIHNRTGGSADNVIKTVTLNLSTETINGTWKLRVNDNAAGDVGYIDSWTITF